MDAADVSRRRQPGDQILENQQVQPHVRRTTHLIAATAVLLSGFSGALGCAAIFNGSTDSVTITSQPQGARVRVNGAPHGRTPVELVLPVGSTYYISVGLAGYEEVSRTVSSSVGGGWVVLDVILTGLLGVLIDAATGAWEGLDADHLHFRLAPVRQPGVDVDYPQSHRTPRGRPTTQHRHERTSKNSKHRLPSLPEQAGRTKRHLPQNNAMVADRRLAPPAGHREDVGQPHRSSVILLSRGTTSKRDAYFISARSRSP